MKSTVAITLITGAIFGSCIKLAEARGRGTYSSRNTNETEILSIFNIVDRRVDGSDIKNESSVPNIGLFKGAIENYTTYQFLEACDFNSLQFKDGVPIDCDTTDNNNVIIQETIPLANLEIKLIENKNIKTELKEWIPSDEFEGNILQYSFLNPTSNQAIARFFLLYKDSNPQPLIYLDGGNFRPFSDVASAINSLQNIGLINDAVLECEAKSYVENSIETGVENCLSGSLLSGPRFEKANTTTVPEHTSNSALLILGILGISLGLKQKRK